MKSDDITVEQLFQDRRQYMVPFYQRTYVWNRWNQWEPLWEDIRAKANDRFFSQSTPHFLGAVVLDPQPKSGLIGVDTLHIIDGQQRLTTLQFILKSVLIVLQQFDSIALSDIVKELLFNSNPNTMRKPEIEQFKVWPTYRDRDDYRSAIHANNRYELRTIFPDSFTQKETLRKIGINHPPALEAIWYFSEQFQNWINEGEKSEISKRIEDLTTAILQDIKVVSIVLDKEDDAQVIFETLNGRGAELHATDLIRNFIFMRADRDGANSKNLYDTYWSKFETDYWKSKQTRGRMQKPRMEWFVHSCLQTELCEEVDLGRLYFEYRRFVFSGEEPISAETQLTTLSKYAGIYQELVDGTGDSPIARFGRRIAPYEVTTLHPLALLIASSPISDEAKDEMLTMLVSYIVRRAICGLTAKNYNNVFISILRELSQKELSPETLRDILWKFKSDASRCPSDGEFRNICTTASIYPGRVDARKMRSFLGEIESKLRSASKTEDVFDADTGSLDIDHILPKSWHEHWPLPNGEKAQWNEKYSIQYKLYADEPLDEREQSIISRENSVGILGNLTLLNLRVNREAQNKPFLEKQKLLLENTNLRLNIPLLGLQRWDEQAIKDRARNLTDIALQIWPGINE